MYMPIIFLSSYFYIKKNNIDYRIFILSQIQNSINMYNYVQSSVNNLLTYYHIPNEDFIIKKVKLNTIENKYGTTFIQQDILYYYKDNKYKIIYDNENDIYKNYKEGDIVDIKIKNNKNSIVLIEIENIKTKETVIVSDVLEKYIKMCAGPNDDFYNFDNQPIYLYKDLTNTYNLDEDIIENNSNYKLKITNMDLNIINKKFNII